MVKHTLSPDVQCEEIRGDEISATDYLYHYDVVCIKDLHGAVRALEALSRPLSSALRVPRPQVLPKVADAPAGYEAADVTLGNLGDHPHMTSALS